MSTSEKYVFGRGAVFAASLMCATALVGFPASAADYGGDCCADLEERVAELEATTARHANRSISLEIYGHVNQALLYWNDSLESDTYVVGNELSSTRLGVKGEGKITSDVAIGYKIEIGLNRDNSNKADQGRLAGDVGDDFGDDIKIRHENVYIKSKTMGTLTLGQQSEATDGIMEIDLGGPSKEIGFNDSDGYVANFHIANGAGLSARRWSNVFETGDGSRGEFIRYDTPAFVGFTLSANWGEDDQYGAAIRYKNDDIAGFKFQAGVGYKNDDETVPNVETIGGSASVKHSASGIFLTGSYASIDRNIVGRDEVTNAYLKAGISQKFTELGETALYGEWQRTENDRNNGSVGELWGVGVGQDLSAVGATMYLGYRHHTASGVTGLADPKPMDAVIAGMKVPF